MKTLFEMLFAPRDNAIYPACGMFTKGHIIASSIFIIAVILALIFTVKMTEKSFNRVLKVFAVIITVMEIIKITYNLSYGYTWVDAWVPLAYCSIFIYSLWLAGFAKGKLKTVGLNFIAISLYAGLFFMIFPTTSLMMHPLFHYLCIHSLTFHSAMMYLGLLIIIRNVITPSKKSFLSYVLYFGAFSLVALIINGITNSNLMMYNAPFNMPIKFIVSIHDFFPPLYTLTIFLAYTALYLLFILTSKIANSIKRK